MEKDQRSSSQSEVDEIAQEMLRELLNNRRFQLHWTEMVVDVLSSSVAPLHNKHTDMDSCLKSSNGNKTGCSAKCTAFWTIMSNSLCELTCAIHLAVENFINNQFASVSLQIPTTAMSHESATIYAIRVQLDRICNAADFKLPQCGLLARRLTRLMKSFTIGLSRPYSIIACASFATCVCDILYRFEEFTALHVNNLFRNYTCCQSAVNAELQEFRRAIDNFYLEVVKVINDKVENVSMDYNCQRKKQQQYIQNRSYSTGKLNDAVRRSPFINHRVVLVNSRSRNGQSDKRRHENRGFILPGKLTAVRRKLHAENAHSRSAPISRESTPILSLADAAQNESRIRKTRSAKLARLSMPEYRMNENFTKLKANEREEIKQTLEYTRKFVDELAHKFNAI